METLKQLLDERKFQLYKQAKYKRDLQTTDRGVHLNYLTVMLQDTVNAIADLDRKITGYDSR